MNRLLERFATMSVLVVDDNQINVNLLTSLLRGLGLTRVSSELDSRRFAAMLPVVEPDLILLDLHMPHLDGHQLLEQVRTYAAGTYLPVLVLTADTGKNSRERALAGGARDFVTKPFDLTEVAQRVANLLETRQLYGAMRSSLLTLQKRPAVESQPVQDVLRDRSITPHFQPVIDLTSGQAVGHEALARFATPHERGPAGWFSDAFEVGLGTELEWMAVTEAVPFLDTAAPHTFLALNMSPATVMLLEHEQLCDSSRCPDLVIELTEHVPVEDYGALHHAFAKMRADGARLAADDLGAGYAGFQHLLALQPDIIKLDISLVQGIDQSRSARALARALLAFAEDVGATVIAEGVEQAGELQVLRDLGVDWAQGFLLGRPEPTAA